MALDGRLREPKVVRDLAVGKTPRCQQQNLELYSGGFALKFALTVLLLRSPQGYPGSGYERVSGAHEPRAAARTAATKSSGEVSPST